MRSHFRRIRLPDYLGELAEGKLRELDGALTVALGLPSNTALPLGRS
jgi:hypothetical protein